MDAGVLAASSPLAESSIDRRDVASDLPAPLKPKAPDLAAPLKPKASAAEVVHLTSRLVSRKSLLALQKMNALIDDPTEDAVLRPGDDDAALVARGILAGFLRRVRTDDVMLASYYRLLRFLVYVLAIVTVIAMQLGVFEGNTTVTYATLTTNVTVSFYDAWKLAAHTDLVRAVIAEGRLCDDAGACYSTEAWQYAEPRAGWNLCHDSDTEFGVDATTVCVFDGDFFVDGLPFRSSELDSAHESFGSAVTLALYGGDWEVRYAFSGYVWTHPTRASPYAVAFPAVRGKVCYVEPGAANETCAHWGACPDAGSCACEFRDDVYTCDDALAATRTLADHPTEIDDARFDLPPYVVDSYPAYAGAEAVASWWDVQGFTVAERLAPSVTEYASEASAETAHRTDDAAEIKGETYAQLPDVLLGYYEGDAVTAGVRFPDLGVPQGALIMDAYVEFTSTALEDGALSLDVRAEASDDALPYGWGADPLGPKDRDATESVVLFETAPWAADETTRTPSLVYLVQEVVDRPGWGSGQALGLVFAPSAGAGSRVARGFAGVYAEAGAPRLFVQYVRAERYTIALGRIDADVVEHAPDGNVFAVSDVELGATSASGVPIATALRFPRIPLLPGQDVVRAHVEFAASASNPDRRSDAAASDFEFRVELAADAAPYDDEEDSGPYDVHGDYHTSAEAEYNLPTRLVSGRTYSNASVIGTIERLEGGARWRTPDLAALIQPVLDDADWQENNSLAFAVRSVDVGYADGAWFAPPGESAYGRSFMSSADASPPELVLLVVGATGRRRPAVADRPTHAFPLDGGADAGAVDDRAEPGADARAVDCKFSHACDLTCGFCYSMLPTPVPSAAPTENRTLWFKNGDAAKDCAWVAALPATRCDVLGWDGAVAWEACEACGATASPTGYPTAPPAAARRRLLAEPARRLDDGACAPGRVNATGSLSAVLYYALVDTYTSESLLTGVAYGDESDAVCLEVGVCYAFEVLEPALPYGATWSVDVGGAALTGAAPFFGYFRLRSGDVVAVDDCDDDAGDYSSDVDGAAAAFWAPFASSAGAGDDDGGGAVECYTKSVWTEPAIPTDDYLGCTRSGSYDALALTKTCPAYGDGDAETHCWSVTLSQPSLDSTACHDVQLVGGCWSDLDDVWPATAAARRAYEDENATFVGEAPPGRGPLVADDCATLAAVYFDATYGATCAGCAGSLCTTQDPAWYANVFGVPSNNVEGALSSLERGKVVEAADCDAFAVLDANCDDAYNHIGCNYDGGACCDDGAFAPDARIRDHDISCRVPWFQSADDTWRYSRVVDGEVFATLWKGVVEVLGVIDAPGNLEEHLSADAAPDRFNSTLPFADVDLADLERYVPSLACPDCPSFEGSYRTVPFSLDVGLPNANGYADWSPKRNPAWTCADFGAADWFDCDAQGVDNTFARERCAACGVTDASESKTQFTSGFDADEPRARYLAKPNLVVYGVLLTQQRNKAMACKKGRPYNRFLSYLDAYDPCLDDDDGLREPFGVDATFVSGSDVYRESNIDEVYDFYDAEELDAVSGMPFGFTYSMRRNATTSEYPKDFPVFWDVNLNRTRAMDIWTLIKDGNYFDGNTRSVELSMITTNRMISSQFLTLTSIVGESLDGGGVEYKYTVSVINPNPYGTPTATVRLFFELVFVALLGGMLLIEVRGCLAAARRRVAKLRVLGDDGAVRYWPGLPACGCLNALPAALRALAEAVAARVADAGLLPTADYVLATLMIVAWVGVVAKAGSLKRFDLHYDRAFATVRELSELIVLYKLLALFLIIAIVCEFLKLMHFHPSMGIITRTIQKAGSRLFFWFILQTTISFLYSILGVMLFGQSSRGFGDGDIPGIFQSFFGFAMLSIAGMYDIGEFENIPGMDAAGLEVFGFAGMSYYITQAFYWSYMALMFFIMFNALLAIICSAYDDVRADIDGLARDPFLYNLLRRVPAPRALPLGALHHVLEAWVGDFIDAEISVDESLDEFVERRRTVVAPAPDPSVHDAVLQAQYAIDEARPNPVARLLYAVHESGAPSDAGFLALDIPVEKRTVGHMFGAATEAAPMDRHAALAMAYNLMSRDGAGCDFNNDGNVEANEAHAVKTLIQSMPVLRDESRSPQSRLVYAYERAFAPDAAAGDAASEGGSSLHRAQEPPTIETKPPPRKHGATRLRHARGPELHLKDVIMRESEAADVPLCGVGSCNAPFVNDVSSFHGPAVCEYDDGGTYPAGGTLKCRFSRRFKIPPADMLAAHEATIEMLSATR
ncbi:hypothetical protein JL722_279 [Aureococcus anophagefferens]|nr:hypothetical protein JL722_279 [Aureococcus anophagefferens]